MTQMWTRGRGRSPKGLTGGQDPRGFESLAPTGTHLANIDVMGADQDATDPTGHGRGVEE